MFSLFKKTIYREEILPQITGSHYGINITFFDYPIRVAEDTQKRRSAYDEFNIDMLEALHEAIPNTDSFITSSSLGPVSLKFMVKNYKMHAQIQLQKKMSKRVFEAELSEAICVVLEKEKIKP
jgi:hypothetical protein